MASLRRWESQTSVSQLARWLSRLANMARYKHDSVACDRLGCCGEGAPYTVTGKRVVVMLWCSRLLSCTRVMGIWTKMVIGDPPLRLWLSLIYGYEDFYYTSCLMRETLGKAGVDTSVATSLTSFCFLFLGI